MASFIPSSADTLEDMLLYTQARLTQVACLDCLASVGVKKNSEHHTSIQWNAAALEACPEFARWDASPLGREIHQGCARLVASIDAAVREGHIDIGAEDGY